MAASETGTLGGRRRWHDGCRRTGEAWYSIQPSYPQSCAVPLSLVTWPRPGSYSNRQCPPIRLLIIHVLYASAVTACEKEGKNAGLRWLQTDAGFYLVFGRFCTVPNHLWCTD